MASVVGQIREKKRVGCVSFLNSKPLIEPLVGRENVEIHFAVPSQLMGLVEKGVVSTALMSIVDYQLSPEPLVLVPAGMIGCDGPTLTVRIFSRVPAERIREVHGDTDSHTSVLLAQVILRERYGVEPEMRAWTSGKAASGGAVGMAPETLLLIGDKVVNAAPSGEEYPYQLDLGEEWKKLAGLPFVFAMWMMRKDAVDGELARMLAEARRQGAEMTQALVEKYARASAGAADLARRYFTEYLGYEVTPRAREGLAEFFERAERCGVLHLSRGVEYLEIAGS